MKIVIVTDSTSDISPQEAEALNIQIIPALLVVDGKEYEDGKGMSREEFYRLLPELDPPPSTAAPSLGMFSQMYQSLLDQNYDKIISIHMASALSSMYGAASTAAKVFGEAVTVIDSGQLSMGLGFQVLAAAHAAAKDTVVSTLQPILEAVHNIQDRIKVIAMLDTMEQLRRSGRVSWVQAGIGTLLQLKLIVELKEGKVLRLGETRTRKKGILRIKQILQNIGEIDQLSILHSNAPDDAQILAEKFPLEGNKLPSIRNVTTVIGTHVGVRALGFAAVIKN